MIPPIDVEKELSHSLIEGRSLGECLPRLLAAYTSLATV